MPLVFMIAESNRLPRSTLKPAFARRLHVDEERHIVADRLPVLDRELDADTARDGDEVNGRVGRAADGRAGDDRVLECSPGENVGGLEVFAHDLDRAPAGFVGDL